MFCTKSCYINVRKITCPPEWLHMQKIKFKLYIAYLLFLWSQGSHKKKWTKSWNNLNMYSQFSHLCPIQNASSQYFSEGFDYPFNRANKLLHFALAKGTILICWQGSRSCIGEMDSAFQKNKAQLIALIPCEFWFWTDRAASVLRKKDLFAWAAAPVRLATGSASISLYHERALFSDNKTIRSTAWRKEKNLERKPPITLSAYQAASRGDPAPKFRNSDLTVNCHPAITDSVNEGRE